MPLLKRTWLTRLTKTNQQLNIVSEIFSPKRPDMFGAFLYELSTSDTLFLNNLPPLLALILALRMMEKNNRSFLPGR